MNNSMLSWLIPDLQRVAKEKYTLQVEDDWIVFGGNILLASSAFRWCTQVIKLGDKMFKKCLGQLC